MLLSTLFCRKSAACQQGTKSASEERKPFLVSRHHRPARLKTGHESVGGRVVGGLKCCLDTGGERGEDEERERQMARGWGERGQD